MRAVRQVLTTTGAGAVIPLDTYVSPFSVGLSVVLASTGTYTVQFTTDDVFAKNYNPATGVWFNSTDTNVVNATASALSNVAFPITAVRLNATANGSSITFTVIQAGLGD